MDCPEDPTVPNTSKQYWKEKRHLAKVHAKEDQDLQKITGLVFTRDQLHQNENHPDNIIKLQK
jgi:hypothetical protein